MDLTLSDDDRDKPDCSRLHLFCAAVDSRRRKMLSDATSRDRVLCSAG